MIFRATYLDRPGKPSHCIESISKSQAYGSIKYRYPHDRIEIAPVLDGDVSIHGDIAFKIGT